MKSWHGRVSYFSSSCSSCTCWWSVSLSSLPTARVHVKTHKYNNSEVQSIPPEQLKTRPIVSGCNSPFDRTSWLVTFILQPLMELVPSHLRNTADFLTSLSNTSPEQRRGLTFFSADVESLYTNIEGLTAVRDVIEFAKEHRSSLKLYGLKLSDLQKILEVNLENSYFIYNRKVYRQLVGLFMGWRPAPILATIRMYMLVLTPRGWCEL